ncbi:MBL fold metallo-hydrolase [Hespellia stercorisuis]|uniref:L-ascorbate metabolism protein UlaG, beta-lactamase superfamily n=1 Tax=Hespellia stercorisuis DSM 15480 TaxID=1121950 RepID=A0A1M6U7C0_9FIRM|nr:MBL fold metallo-hydrolase [Hespellia stercorisuis]SHK65152.1 L-ascorbate metabolism protein UlaG, beta-lactamase superfamily [Hespellia stercorisuis DSM 15480]
MLENIKVLSHSSIRIEDGKVMYFDPFQVEEEPHDADIIFITHSHYDHFSPEDIQKIVKEDTLFVVPKTILADIEILHLGEDRIYALAPGEHTTVDGIRVEAVRAYNVGKKFHPKSNEWVGYIVCAGAIRYYIAGDTDMNEDNLGVKCDVALVPVGGTYTMDAEQAVEFVNILAPKAAVPTHYGSIVGEVKDAQDFVRNVSGNVQAVIR